MRRVSVKDLKVGGCYLGGNIIFTVREVWQRKEQYHIRFEKGVNWPITGISEIVVGPLATFYEADEFQLDKALKLKKMAETGILDIINHIATE